MRVLTCEEVRKIERDAVGRAHISEAALIQRAGYAVAQFCLAHFRFRSVCAVCGAGNNGAAGLAVAQVLSEVAERISVIILAPDESTLSTEASALCSTLAVKPIWISEEADFQDSAVQQALEADLIIDVVAGPFGKPPLEQTAKRAVEAINRAPGTIVSVDVPSGVDPDSKFPIHQGSSEAIYAHGVVTFVAPKPAHVFGGLTSGPIAVSELGIQPALASNQTSLSVTTGQEAGIAFPPRPDDAHKGHFGHVLVIAGSLGKAGAAGLAGMAALRTGAGLVTVACPKSVQATVAGFAPELMTEGLRETSEGTIALEALGKVQTLLAGTDIIVLGPGLSRNDETAEFVRRLVASCSLPLVIDADGLNAFAGQASDLKPNGDAPSFRVLTPHPGEAARLIGVSTRDIQADRQGAVRRISSQTGACVVLKGWRSVVAGASGETWLNMTGNPALAKGGTGDVLSGMIGAALARHADNTSAFLLDARVAAAVYLHGLAGDLARDMLHENTVLATDLLQNLDEAFRDCESQMDRGLFYLHR